jgi:protein TonB
MAVEELPEFPGGTNAMNAWITNNKKNLSAGISEKIDGQVYVTFIVTSKGKISTPLIKKSLHPLLDLEALRLVNNMPDWKPGKQDGKPVDVQMMIPVEFRLK